MTTLKTILGVGALCGVGLWGAAEAATLPVTVTAKTHVQVQLDYTAPDSNPCTVEVSESASYTPVVHDVNATLYTAADTDTSRDSTITTGLDRTVLVGRYGMHVPAAAGSNMFLALDAKVYSRALRSGATHYYRVVCGADSGTGTFTTEVYPAGVTRVDPQPTSGPGTYNWPTVPNPTLRTGEIIDPQTGGRMWKIATKALDELPGHVFPDWPSGGMNDICSMLVFRGGVFCRFQDDNMFIFLFWVHTTTNQVVNLGTMTVSAVAGDDGWDGAYGVFGGWDPTTPGTVYATVTTRSGKYALVKLTAISVTDDEDPVAPGGGYAVLTNTPLMTAPNFLGEKVTAYDARFVASKYGGWTAGMQNGKILLATSRYQQDAYGWLAVYDPGTNAVVASMPFGESEATRWCGIHTAHNWGSQMPYYGVAPTSAGNDPSSSTGPWRTTLVGAVTASTTAITVSGEPVCTNGNVNLCYGATAANDTHWMDVAVGDLFYFGDAYEEVRVTGKASATSWTVQRGVNSTAVGHANGAYLQSKCKLAGPGAYYEFAWDWAADPLGSGSGVHTVTSTFGGHFAARKTSSGATFVTNAAQGSTVALPGGFTAPANVATPPAPVWAGITPPYYTNALEGHPSTQNLESTSAADWNFYVDGHPTVAGNLWSTYPGVTLVSGQLYRYNPGAATIDPKHFMLAGSTQYVPLVDISGPAASLGTGAGDQYKFCVVHRDGECAAGATAGQIYLNIPAPTYLYCGGGEGVPGSPDACIFNWPQYADAVAQHDIRPSKPVSRVGATLVNTRHSQSNRNSRWIPGNWLVYRTAWDNNNIWRVEVPAWDVATGGTADYSTYLQSEVTVPDVSGTHPTIHNAVVEWGYLEYGTPAQYYCTPRQEACRRGTQTGLNYAFAGDSVTGVACATGCTLYVPVIPMRLAYARAVYRDSGNTVLGYSAPFVASGVPAAASAPVPTVALTATPTVVASGSASTLNWSSTDATSCTASVGWSGSKSLSGSASTGALTVSTTYTLTCSGAGGDGVASVTVTVQPPAPTVQLDASPTAIVAGSAATLTWSSTNASVCTASGDWTGSQTTSGTVSTGALATVKTYSYTLTCTGNSQQGADTATVVVSAAPSADVPPTIIITGMTWTRHKISVTAEASDDNDVVRVELWIDGVKVTEDTQEPWTFVVNTRTYAKGDHVIQVKAFDAASPAQSATSLSITFTR